MSPTLFRQGNLQNANRPCRVIEILQFNEVGGPYASDLRLGLAGCHPQTWLIGWEPVTIIVNGPRFAKILRRSG